MPNTNKVPLAGRAGGAVALSSLLLLTGCAGSGASGANGGLGGGGRPVGGSVDGPGRAQVLGSAAQWAASHETDPERAALEFYEVLARRELACRDDLLHAALLGAGIHRATYRERVDEAGSLNWIDSRDWYAGPLQVVTLEDAARILDAAVLRNTPDGASLARVKAAGLVPRLAVAQAPLTGAQALSIARTIDGADADSATPVAYAGASSSEAPEFERVPAPEPIPLDADAGNPAPATDAGGRIDLTDDPAPVPVVVAPRAREADEPQPAGASGESFEMFDPEPARSEATAPGRVSPAGAPEGTPAQPDAAPIAGARAEPLPDVPMGTARPDVNPTEYPPVDRAPARVPSSVAGVPEALGYWILGRPLEK